ncbi:MAG TPA: Holliday junction resolvase RuvX, partial [Spirochaetota bacterium]|nr:Holliday junction resolvase RuvX [Spirochaetota bacterium]
MRLLGLDVGEKTIGCALADDTGIVVSPAKPIQRQNGSMALGQLRRIIKKNNVKGIIIGLPYNMDGSKGERFRKVKGYAGKLKKHFKELFFD